MTKTDWTMVGHFLKQTEYSLSQFKTELGFIVIEDDEEYDAIMKMISILERKLDEAKAVEDKKQLKRILRINEVINK